MPANVKTTAAILAEYQNVKTARALEHRYIARHPNEVLLAEYIHCVQDERLRYKSILRAAITLRQEMWGSTLKFLPATLVVLSKCHHLSCS
jgi:hypothetical protein